MPDSVLLVLLNEVLLCYWEISHIIRIILT